MTEPRPEVPPAVRRDPDDTHDRTPAARAPLAPLPADASSTGRRRWVASGETVAAHVARPCSTSLDGTVTIHPAGRRVV